MPKSNHSEIFDRFLQIATDKGLISHGKPEQTEKTLKSPRWDSLDISAIEALYGVKPDMPKEMEYTNNIMETAHPTSMVIAPSYDKLNGLVENNNELQNILMHICYKEPEMGSTNQGRYPEKVKMIYPDTMGNKSKYAKRDLLLTLVKVANDMDNKSKEELRILADTCLTQLHSQEFVKQAFWPWLVGAALILATIYMKEHLDDTDQGIRQNYSRLQDELGDFLTASESFGFGHQYDESLKDQVAQLQALLNEFWSAYSQAMPVLLSLEKPKNAQDLITQASAPATRSLQQAYQVLQSETNKLKPVLDNVVQNFNNPDFKAEHTVEKGAVTSLIDSVPFLHGGKGSLTADDFDDVVNAINPFEASIQRLLHVLAQANQHKISIQQDVNASTSKTPAAETPVATPPPAQKTVQDLDQEASGLDKAFEGLKGLTGMGD
jgi:hypothetical protein